VSVELVHSQPTADLKTRVTRMEMDAVALRKLSRAEVRAIYDKLETVRDALSRILDRADGKNA
jgi:hypothetical protein